MYFSSLLGLNGGRAEERAFLGPQFRRSAGSLGRVYAQRSAPLLSECCHPCTGSPPTAHPATVLAGTATEAMRAMCSAKCLHANIPLPAVRVDGGWRRKWLAAVRRQAPTNAVSLCGCDSQCWPDMVALLRYCRYGGCTCLAASQLWRGSRLTLRRAARALPYMPAAAAAAAAVGSIWVILDAAKFEEDSGNMFVSLFASVELVALPGC